jgi:transposase
MSRRTRSKETVKPATTPAETASARKKRPAEKVDLRAHALAPDLEAIRRFMVDMITRRAIPELISAVLALLQRMREINTELMARIATKSRKRPPSETLRRLQLELPLMFATPANDTAGAELEGPPEPPLLLPPLGRSPSPEEEKREAEKNRDNHGRRKFPRHLLRIPGLRAYVSAAKRVCPRCRRRTTTLGFKTSEKLTVRPSEYVVEQEEVETCSCGKCHAYIVTAQKPKEVVPRGVLGNELLVQSLVDHYDNAVPWERMEQTARQQDVPLSANTLAASVGAAIDHFEPVVEHIKENSLASSHTALDATSIKVLDEEHPLGIRTGSLWLIEGDHRHAYFVFAATAHASHIDDLLRGRTLASVMCDGSPTNNCVERAGGKRGGCNAHARRGLVKALRLGDLRAVRGLDLFAKLFHVDAESKRLGENIKERFVRRQRESAAIVGELEAWKDTMRGEVEPKSELGQAIGYIHRQWSRLTAFLRDPRMPLTNNEVERDLRRWVLDRKTWMFVGHDTSARAADAMTLLTTCRKMGVEPRRYLRETLAQILAGETNPIVLAPETFAQKVAAEKAAAAAFAPAAA